MPRALVIIFGNCRCRFGHARTVSLKLFKYVIDLELLIEDGNNSSQTRVTYHSWRQLPIPAPAFNLCLVQGLFSPSSNNCLVLNLLPPVGFFPDAIGESAHPHLNDLAEKRTRGVNWVRYSEKYHHSQSSGVPSLAVVLRKYCCKLIPGRGG